MSVQVAFAAQVVESSHSLLSKWSHTPTDNYHDYTVIISFDLLIIIHFPNKFIKLAFKVRKSRSVSRRFDDYKIINHVFNQWRKQDFFLQGRCFNNWMQTVMPRQPGGGGGGVVVTPTHFSSQKVESISQTWGKDIFGLYQTL